MRNDVLERIHEGHQGVVKCRDCTGQTAWWPELSSHGIPETFMSDDDLQFSGAAVKAFASDYGFDHVTSSPKFPPSNREAERAIQTIKNLLKKAQDPYRALLAYRATFEQWLQPSCSWDITFAPHLSGDSVAALPDLQVLQYKGREQREQGTRHFSLRRRAIALSELLTGDSVWISDAKTEGTVISKHHSPGSYLVRYCFVDYTKNVYGCVLKPELRLN